MSDDFEIDLTHYNPATQDYPRSRWIEPPAGMIIAWHWQTYRMAAVHIGAHGWYTTKLDQQHPWSWDRLCWEFPPDEGHYTVMRPGDRLSFPMSRSCICGNRTGRSQMKGGQEVVSCAECGSYVYNRPIRERLDYENDGGR